MLNFQNSVKFQQGQLAPVLLRNFYAPETEFAWSTSTWSEIIFAFAGGTSPAGKSADLMVEMDVFKSPPKLPCQPVLFYLNGLRIGSRNVSDRVTVILTFDRSLLRPTENVLIFDTPKASVPNDFGISDGRCLGVQLFSLQIRPSD